MDLLAEGEGEEILRKTLEDAKNGDVTARKLVLDRIWPGREESDIELLAQFWDKRTSRLKASAGYWYWPDQPVAECGAATSILEEAGFDTARLKSCADANLLPDCEGLIDGLPAGIEVTELVHEKALARSLHSNRTFWFL
jgi:hypothetical protein